MLRITLERGLKSPVSPECPPLCSQAPDWSAFRAAKAVRYPNWG